MNGAASMLPSMSSSTKAMAAGATSNTASLVDTESRGQAMNGASTCVLIVNLGGVNDERRRSKMPSYHAELHKAMAAGADLRHCQWRRSKPRPRRQHASYCVQLHTAMAAVVDLNTANRDAASPDQCTIDCDHILIDRSVWRTYWFCAALDTVASCPAATRYEV